MMNGNGVLILLLSRIFILENDIINAMEWVEYSESLFGVTLSSKQREQFEQYEALLIEWNEKINLTAVKEREMIQVKHFLDSIACAQVLGSLNQKSFIDIGTGAGFPGIPLHILFPEMKLTLVDSVEKKTAFCEIVSKALNLTQTKCLHARAEELGLSKEHREKYDVAAARAVARLPILCEFLLPLVRPGGVMLAQKGETAEAEIADSENAIRVLGGGETKLSEYTLPEVEGKRYLISIKKLKKTPPGYPRRVGLPAKRPI